MLAKLTADSRMKAANGHSFETILKTRCVYCWRSPKAKGRCSAWFQTFLRQLDVVMMNLDRERAEWAAQRARIRPEAVAIDPSVKLTKGGLEIEEGQK